MFARAYTYSVEYENVLALSNNKTGITIDTASTDYPTGTFTVTNSTSALNGTQFTPSSNSGYSGTNTTNSGLGNPICIPRNNTTLAGTGTGGRDRGANVKKRYVDGTLTTQNLWVPFAALPATTQATCPTNSSGWYFYNQRACVAAVNRDGALATTSLYSIADRLGITSAILNSCEPDNTY